MRMSGLQIQKNTITYSVFKNCLEALKTRDNDIFPSLNCPIKMGEIAHGPSQQLNQKEVFQA